MATRFRISLLSTVALAITTTAMQAQTAPTVYPVPITTALAGLGSAATSTCAANIVATDGANYGDGCVGTLARLSSPQGAAVDKFGNVYVADYSDRLIRVVYNGGAAVAAAITAANSGYAVSSSRNAPATVPVVGNIYTLAGVGAGITAFTALATDGNFSCANYSASGQPEASDFIGDGCPGGAAFIGARDVNVDNDGNLILTDYADNRIRVLCINCSASALATGLIELQNPGVIPANGKIYTVAGFSSASATGVGYRDIFPGYGNAATTPVTAIPTTPMTSALFRSPSASAVSSSEDIFVADNLNNAVRVIYNGGTAANNILTAEGFTNLKLGYVYTVAGLGCDSADTTHTGATASANSCKTTTPTDVATIASAPGVANTATTVGVGISVPWTVYLDANGNVFYTDAGNARVKVIYAGIGAPLTLPNTTYPTLKTGYTYSYAGQGTLTASGIVPNLEKLTSAQGVGGDSNGNIFFIDYTTGLFYETYARTGVTAIIGGGAGVATPAAGTRCNGTAGPSMTDAYFNGCPATQTTYSSPRGPLVADANGSLYFGDSVGYFLRKLNYNTTFPTEPVGTASVSQPLAFTSAALVGTGALIEGASSGSDFSDAGGDTCPSTVAGTTCVVNVIFKPATPGFKTGAASTALAGVTQGYSLLSGTATGAALTVDPGTATTTGTALIPNAIAVDGSSRVYVVDSTTKSVIRYSGSTPTTVATGFTAPAGVAVDGVGNVFIADSTSVKEVSVLGPATPITLVSGLSGPNGLATDTLGNLYIADTGNNRIIEAPAGVPVGTIATVALTGLTAPKDVVVDLSGSLYAIDGSHIVKLTTAGVQTTVAAAGGTALAVDAAGNVFATSGTTLTEYPAGGGASVALYTTLTTPKGLVLDGVGNAYVADNSFTGYYELARTAGFYKFATSPSTTTLNVTSSGTASVASTAFTASEVVDYNVAAATTNGCSGALAAGANCALTAKYNSTSACVTPDSVLFTSPVTNGAPGFTLTSSSVAACMYVTALPATITYGATETLTATITGATATGSTVTFYSGSTVLGTGIVGVNGTATYSYIPAVGSYSITATNAAPALTAAATSFTVNPATPSISLNVSPNTGYTTTTYTLTATVTATYGTPTGSVSFANGATSLGSATLNGNTATLMVSTLPAGNDCISATYVANGNYTTITTSSCSPVSVAAGFAIVASSTALAFPSASYQEAQAFFTITPGGRTDTLSFACSGLPAKISCAFSPATLSLSGLSATQTIQMLVSNSNAKASNSEAPLAFQRDVALASLPFAALLLFGLRRRKGTVAKLTAASLLALIILISVSNLSGCSNSPTAVQQSSGTYPFTVTVSNGTTTVQTINFTLSVP